MEFVADTVTIIRHFSGSAKLGAQARRLMAEADAGTHRVYVPVFVLVEILYLSERARIPVSLEIVRARIESSINYQIADLTATIVDRAQRMAGLELHDRLIVATASELGLPLVTSDSEITASGLVKVLW